VTIILKSLKEQDKLIKTNAGASLIDIGDGVACLEFHSKMNTIGLETISMLNLALKELETNFEGLLIGNQGKNFSVGANLMLIFLMAQEKEWDELDLMIRSLQKAIMSIKYSKKPIVTAPFEITFGGGCEFAIAGTRSVALDETHMGLVEFGVGLIPAGGGTKEMLIRCIDKNPPDLDSNSYTFVRKLFQIIGMSKVSTSAVNAKEIGFLREDDLICTNKDEQIEEAKKLVLDLSKSYIPQELKQDILAIGYSGIENIKEGLDILKESSYISEYDYFISEKLAYIICGGDSINIKKVSEQDILDLEREAFLSLCGQRKTQERILHMLKTGKTLRN